MVRSLHSRQVVRVLHNMDESECANRLLDRAGFSRKAAERVRICAIDLIRQARRHGIGDVEAFLQEYNLSQTDGIALMGLAEALLRIPDADTRNDLIREKLGQGHWAKHRGHSPSKLVNLSTGALAAAEALSVHPSLSAPLRLALEQGIQRLGGAFVMGETIDEALAGAALHEAAGYRLSYDMLGEAAKTTAQAEHYFHAYLRAIETVGLESAGRGPVAGPGVSIKLSALLPRFEALQSERIAAHLIPRLAELCRAAKAHDIGLTVDAEEADRLEPSLDIMEAMIVDRALDGWEGLGMAVQAYQKRAFGVVDWAIEAARSAGKRLNIRLVKGAYWDSEIKKAQERGFQSYPVFTVKSWTDASYLSCAKVLLEAGAAIRPAFAGHNALTIASVLELAGGNRDWEFQRLHGMGIGLFSELGKRIPCRLYAPVGAYGELLPYLVRRLLENGANTSFVHDLADMDRNAEELAQAVKPTLPLAPPPLIFMPARRNSCGYDVSDGESISNLQDSLRVWNGRSFQAGPIVSGIAAEAGGSPVRSPYDFENIIGNVVDSHGGMVDIAVNHAADAFSGWDGLGGPARAAILECAADMIEADPSEFLYLLLSEAGKTWLDALAEIRECVDFLRFYAAEARRLFAGAMDLPSVSGERNQLELRGRGVFACISPWNFPLAIFVGQIAAALAAGNTAAAKPAPQTPLIAAAAVRLLHRSGVPEKCLALLPGNSALGAALAGNPQLAGVSFTGSHAAARKIAATLAAGQGPLIPIIAETGGLNAMIVDSSALPEQVVGDVIDSAFLSAGQRCSALRVLFLQDDCAQKILPILAGALAQMRIGAPWDPSVDVGPVIDEAALQRLVDYDRALSKYGRLLAKLDEPTGGKGWFFGPRIYEVDWEHAPKAEMFGPILHVIRWRRSEIDRIFDWLQKTGYGLTLGIHSRIDAFSEHIREKVRIGNIYVNRGMTGAMVGCQPFGGMGLSGTGPKAGGPYTLLRYATETTLTINYAAVGGDAALLCGEQNSNM